MDPKTLNEKLEELDKARSNYIAHQHPSQKEPFPKEAVALSKVFRYQLSRNPGVIQINLREETCTFPKDVLEISFIELSQRCVSRMDIDPTGIVVYLQEGSYNLPGLQVLSVEEGMVVIGREEE